VVMDNDTGQLFNPSPGECMRVFVTLLLQQGISEDDIRTMLVKNTAEMIGI
jgi:predicted metal-dependent phosphotriesterase family hydrolase